MDMPRKADIAIAAMAASSMAPGVRTLLIDNYDSYTFNLYQLLASVNGVAPVVIRNDQLSWNELQPKLALFDNVVISPGPGSAVQAADFGVCTALLRHGRSVPVLGVCLGHQGMAIAAGGTIEHAPEVRHGRLSKIRHVETGLFAGVPSPFDAVRYHSLRVAPHGLPHDVEVLAWSEGDESIMALRLRSAPFWGVQFHPESICTQYGRELVLNFQRLAAEHNAAYGRVNAFDSTMAEFEQLRATWSTVLARALQPGIAPTMAKEDEPLTMRVQRLHAINAAAIATTTFERLFLGQPGAFWLDSAKVERGLSRFSFMGCATGPLGARVDYDAQTQSATVLLHTEDQRSLHFSTADHSGFLQWMRDKSEQLRVSQADAAAVPFQFCGGWVGYLAYELRSECADMVSAGAMPSSPKVLPAASLAQLVRREVEDSMSSTMSSSSQISSADHEDRRDGSLEHPAAREDSVPAASFVLVDRFIAFDHETSDCYIVCLDARHDIDLWPGHARFDAAAAQVANTLWSETITALLRELHSQAAGAALERAAQPDRQAFRKHLQEQAEASTIVPKAAVPPTFTLALPRADYLDAVDVSLERIRDGETYEVCLTTQLRTRTPGRLDAWKLYKRLRRDNPAPYAAYLCLGELTVASSSPERFLKIDANGRAESKPIKGTARRGATPDEDDAIKARLHGSEKDFAENLMIVDLLRNDLGKVCATGSVDVPRFMAIESYASVHQLVSTVTGYLRSDVTSFDCMQQVFPPGSMTGAPKRRTMDIIDQLESVQRGIYSGAVGFFSFSGSADFAVVIRTAVVNRDVISVGAGGAIVAQSDRVDEYEEMVLKASSVLPSVYTEICEQFS